MTKIMKKVITLLMFLLLLISCGTTKEQSPQIYSVTIPLSLSKMPQSNIYINLDYGIRLNVVDKRADNKILNKYEVNLEIPKPDTSSYPEVQSFVSESLKKYMKTMGFVLDSDINTDYMLQVEVTQFQLSYLSGMGWMGTVCFDIQIFDENRKQVYPRTNITGRHSVMSSYNDYSAAAKAMNTAFSNALDNIDWNRIAYFLKRSDSAFEEKNKQVTGKGNTALEHTIIRWFVDSAPKGADVYWRVISSTPDVKNTNALYLGSTPYESTEAFDIKGLTFNNSGDVQIEISCEKIGYVTQKKRFNLRQAIEQKEISTKFNLVSE